MLFNTFLERFHRDRFVRRMPLCLKNEGRQHLVTAYCLTLSCALELLGKELAIFDTVVGDSFATGF